MNKLSVSSLSSSDSAYFGDQQCLSNSSTGGLALENIVLYFFLEAKLLHNLASLNSVSHWVYYFFLLYFGLSSYCKYSYIADCLFFSFYPSFSLMPYLPNATLLWTVCPCSIRKPKYKTIF